MAETANIAKMADIVSSEMFKFFRWEQVGPKDTNFSCVNKIKHLQYKGGKKVDKGLTEDEANKYEHTHPTDVVFHYVDPYKNKSVYLHTDLKSYAASSIGPNQVRKWLKSLSVSIECAKLSSEWRDRYSKEAEETPDVVGLLFVYNHDGLYKNNFFDYFKSDKNRSPTNGKKENGRLIKIGSIPLERNQYISIFDPGMINRLHNIVSDIKILRGDRKFPYGAGYYFFYPSLTMHRPNHDPYERPATVEMLTDPCMIIWHDSVEVEGEKYLDEGVLVYFNRESVSYRDFVYLFDKLASYQLLEGEHLIRVRVQPILQADFKGVFNQAVREYSRAWGYDNYKLEKLQRIEVGYIANVAKHLVDVDVGRDS